MPGYDYQHLLNGMVQTFLTVPFPNAKPGDPEYNMTLDLIKNIASPVHEHVVSWWNETGGGIFPDEKVKMHINDPVSGYLSDKIDGNTIRYDTSTNKLYVSAIPLASNNIRGGIKVGATASSVLYMAGEELMLRVNTEQSLSSQDNEVPSCRAVKLYVDNTLQNITINGGIGDMLKSTYDSNNNGVVDNSERLSGQLPNYYLNWGNFTNTPTTLAGYGINDVYTKSNLQTQGQAQVYWGNITYLPTTLAGYGINDVYTKDNLKTLNQAQVHWGNIINPPTTLAGYGITDTYTKNDLVTSGSAQVHWNNITNKPTVYPPMSHTHTQYVTKPQAIAFAIALG